VNDDRFATWIAATTGGRRSALALYGFFALITACAAGALARDGHWLATGICATAAALSLLVGVVVWTLAESAPEPHRPPRRRRLRRRAGPRAGERR